MAPRYERGNRCIEAFRVRYAPRQPLLSATAGIICAEIAVADKLAERAPVIGFSPRSYRREQLQSYKREPKGGLGWVEDAPYRQFVTRRDAKRVAR